MTIEEQIILQYAIPRTPSNQEDAPCLHGEEIKRQRQADGSRIDRDRISVPVNWDQVLELALFHDVFPSVYRNLEDTGWREVPEDAVRKFREKWHEHLARNLILSHEMDRILELFARGGVKAIPLKGIFLARMLYPDTILRSFNDLDIWVRPSDAKRAGELLQQIGYELRFGNNGQSYSAENEYSIPFHRYFPHTRIYVDLHWSLAKSRDYPAIPEERWWQQAREGRISGQGSSTRNFSKQSPSEQRSSDRGSSDQMVSDQDFSGQCPFLLAPEDLFIYLTIQIHASAYCYLKHFVDIYQFLSRWGDQLDCKYIYQTARDIGIVNNLFFVLLTVRNLFDKPIDRPINPSIYSLTKVPINVSINAPNNALTNASTNVSNNASNIRSINTMLDTLLIQLKSNQQVKQRTGFLRFYFLRHIFNRQTILSGKYNRDLRQGFCLLLYDRLTQSISSSLRVLFPSAEGIAARYQLLPYSKKIYLYYCLNPFLIMYWLFRGLVVKSSDAHGLGILVGPVSSGQR